MKTTTPSPGASVPAGRPALAVRLLSRITSRRIHNPGLAPRLSQRPREGWTLVELIGVLAITSLLAVFGTAAAMSYCDEQARNRERATLEEIGLALRRSVAHDLLIPDETGYAAKVAIFSGQPMEAVLKNRRGHPRLLLIDPAVTNSGFDLPFDQTEEAREGAGAGILSNVRMILVSSLDAPFTNGLPAAPGGRPSGALFSNLWSTPHGTLPAGSQWKGDPHDLFIHRIRLQDLFEPVSFNHSETTGIYTNGQLRIAGMETFGPPTDAPLPCARWYLSGTPLTLSNAADRSTFSEIIHEPVTYTYEKGFWLRGGNGLISETGLRSGITGADFEEAVRQFLASSVVEEDDDGNNGNSGKKDKKDNNGNSGNSGGEGSRLAAEAVVNAMSNYVRLGAMGPQQHSQMEDPLDDLHDALLDYTGLPPGQLNKP